MALALADVTDALAAISSIAVIAGAGFIVLQLRQNAPADWSIDPPTEV